MKDDLVLITVLGRARLGSARQAYHTDDNDRRAHLEARNAILDYIDPQRGDPGHLDGAGGFPVRKAKVTVADREVCAINIHGLISVAAAVLTRYMREPLTRLPASMLPPCCHQR